MTGEKKIAAISITLNEDTAEIAEAVFDNKYLRVLFNAVKDVSL